MTTTTVRVSENTHALLQDLSRAEGVSMQQILQKALDQYRRERLLSATNAAYAAVRADQKSWSEVEAERASWDATLVDGLEEA